MAAYLLDEDRQGVEDGNKSQNQQNELRDPILHDSEAELE